jgi:hypothetical protein
MALRRSWVRIPLGPPDNLISTAKAGVVGYLPESWGHRVKAPTMVPAEYQNTELACYLS